MINNCLLFVSFTLLDSTLELSNNYLITFCILRHISYHTSSFIFVFLKHFNTNLLEKWLFVKSYVPVKNTLSSVFQYGAGAFSFSSDGVDYILIIRNGGGIIGSFNCRRRDCQIVEIVQEEAYQLGIMDEFGNSSRILMVIKEVLILGLGRHMGWFRS